MSEPEITRQHLEAFLEICERRSIQAAARASGRSRATYGRYLAELEAFFGESELLRRSPGQRSGVPTPAGEELAQRARLLLQHWDQWLVSTADALQQRRRAVRVGALPGTLDLISDLLAELRAGDPDLPLYVVECLDDELAKAVARGDVDLGFGTLDPAGVPPRLRFHDLGELPWVVIVPSAEAPRWPAHLSLVDLDGAPMVVTRGGPARAALARAFAEHPEGPLHLQRAVEVGSTPRVVEAVARGFGVAVVSRFRAAFLPAGVELRALEGGPPVLRAGAFSRRGDTLSGAGAELLERARRRFAEVSTQGLSAERAG
ncbi:MAG: LysR family transcriptional regulator [Myxococcales bacterium]|nr:LysR family transcriptional regulator [Myxococcales bacterium]